MSQPQKTTVAPQRIVPLSGCWFVESIGGQRVEIGTGAVAFGEDQGTKAVGDREGHRSGTFGNEPDVPMIVRLGKPQRYSPCRFA